MSEIDPSYQPMPSPPPPSASDRGRDASEVVDVGRLGRAAAERFGCRYGGDWVDGEGEDSTYVVGVVDPTEADRQWLRDSDPTGRARIEAVAEGYADLERWAQRASQIASRRGVRELLAAPDPRIGKVVVHGRELSQELRNSVRSEVPDERLVFEERSDFELRQTHGSRDNWNAFIVHYEGGLRVRVHVSSTTFNNCTTGYFVRGAFGNFGTTAGHCGGIPAPVRSPDGSFQDQIRDESYWDRTTVDSDASVFSTQSITNYPRVMVGTGHRNVASRFSAPHPSVGFNGLCLNGATSNTESCGTVNSANAFAPADVNGRSVRLWCVGIASLGQPGDSGGPAYRVLTDGRVHAAGVIYGRATVGGVGSGCFTHIFYLLDNNGMTLVTG